jgi:hypothetical protein
MPEASAGESRTASRAGIERVNIPCMLRREQADGLRRLSLREDLPCSTLIRQAVDRLLKESGVLTEAGS